MLVLLALADCANDDGRCWPSLAYLADRSRMTRRSVQRAIKGLVRDGHIEMESNAGPSGVNLYRVRLDQSLDLEISDEGGRKNVTRDNFTPGAQMSPVTITSISTLKDVAKKELDRQDYAIRFLAVFGVALTIERLAVWEKRWPGRTFEDDLNEAMDWIESNPRKGPKNKKRPWTFLTRWMRRAEDFRASERSGNSRADAHDRNVRTDMDTMASQVRSGRTQVARDVIDKVRRENRIPMKGRQ